MNTNQKILICGASGLIGSALRERLRARGAEIFEFSHRNPQPLPAELDIVINLAGENIGNRRWSAAQKKEIIASRVARTQELTEKLAKIARPPSLVLSASAIGYYGNRGKTILSEDDPPGDQFLSTLAVQWEAAARQAERFGATVTLMRFGIVLTPSGGALGKILLPFRLGLGGVIGSGEQYMSWISLDDLLRAIEFLIDRRIAGAVNICSPDACTNREFTQALASSLQRPAFLPLPEFVVKLLLGEMGDALLLSSTRVSPRVLMKEGFSFTEPRLGEYLAGALA